MGSELTTATMKSACVAVLAVLLAAKVAVGGKRKPCADADPSGESVTASTVKNTKRFFMSRVQS